MSTTLAMRLRGKFARSAAHRGIFLTLVYIPVLPAAKLAVAAWERMPGRRRRTVERRRAAEEFDQAHGVDTAGLLDVRGVEVVGDNQEHGFHYLGTDSSVFQDAIGSLPIDH